MQLFPSIAIVGRPNVGKSRLFNRLVGRRLSIVHDRPGVTRDVVTEDLDGYTLMDTGGIGLGEADTPEEIRSAMEQQVFVAVEGSGLVLFVVDAREGLVPLDLMVADRLRSAGARVVLVVNKCDNSSLETETWEFGKLGFGDPLPVSAEHNLGIPDLWKCIRKNLAPVQAAGDVPDRVGIVFIGRPNVGKSSLTNRLLREERVIVSEIPGTTRDSVALDLDFQDRGGKVLPFKLYDTAGLRKKAKVDNSLEYFSGLRTETAVEKADVAILVLDALEGVSKQDQVLGGKAHSMGKPVLVAVNKWDLAKAAVREGRVRDFDDERAFREAYEEAARKELFFLPEVPFVFVSAASGFAVERMLRAARTLDQVQRKVIRTGKLNQIVQSIVTKNPPKKISGRSFKIYYTVQTGHRPFRFRIFCNHRHRLEAPYRRYFEKELSKQLDLRGLPLILNWVDRGTGKK